MQRGHNRKKINNSSERIPDALKFVIDFTKQRGYPPSVREIGRHVGVSSSSTIHKFIRKCVDEGYVEIDEKVSRSIRVSKSGKKLISASK